MRNVEITTGRLEGFQTDMLLCLAGTVLPGGGEISGALLRQAAIPLAEAPAQDAEIRLLGGRLLYAQGPIWPEKRADEGKRLGEVYRQCFEKACTMGCQTLVIPAIPSGVHDSRLFQVAAILILSVRAYMRSHTLPCHFRIVCADEETEARYKQAYNFYMADTKAERME